MPTEAINSLSGHGQGRRGREQRNAEEQRHGQRRQGQKDAAVHHRLLFHIGGPVKRHPKGRFDAMVAADGSQILMIQ
jgi:hypothetical protein